MSDPIIIPTLPVDARCHRCSRRTDLIAGEDVIVCGPCVAYYGHIADDPTSVDDGVLTALLSRHAATVRLMRADGTTERLRWQA